MTSDADAKLPIPTYDIHGYGSAGMSGHRSMSYESIEARPEHLGDWCKADDVRGLVERAESAERLLQVMCKQCNSAQSLLGKAEAQRDRLASHLREIMRRFGLYQARSTIEDLTYLAGAVQDSREALADIEKENA